MCSVFYSASSNGEAAELALLISSQFIMRKNMSLLFSCIVNLAPHFTYGTCIKRHYPLGVNQPFRELKYFTI